MLDFIFGNKNNKGKKETKNSPDKTTPAVIDVGEFVLNTFLTLTSHTYPYGYEDYLVKKLLHLKLFPENIQKDKYGNYFYKIGESRTMFTSHLDTACRDSGPVTHVIDRNYIKTNGSTILGADDKAGVTIMLWMIKNNIPGLYYFFIGEEVGCVGSGLAAKHINFRGDYDRCISFDRRSTESVITHQSSTRCCSDQFADQLASELNKSGLEYEKDDSGIYTDSAEFTSEIPECTNLSVGYYDEHTVKESQDIEHLVKLTEACLVVNWESLVTKRDPSKTEYKSWGRTYATTYTPPSTKSTSVKTHGSWRDRDYDYGFWGTPDSDFPKKEDLKKTYGYHDDFYKDDDEDEDDFHRKTRRGGKHNKKKGKAYVDNGGGLTELSYDELETSFINDSNNHKTNTYEWVKFKFLNKDLSKEELAVVKEQYFDMSDPDDKKFYEIIESYVTG